jgi:hypothetical protein
LIPKEKFWVGWHLLFLLFHLAPNLLFCKDFKAIAFQK